MGLIGKWHWLMRTLPALPENVAMTLADPAFFPQWLKVQSHTMLPYARLNRLYNAVARVSREGIPGDIVECGTARGGSLALLAQANRRFPSNLVSSRTIWSFDTFEGIPAPTLDDPDYLVARVHTGDFRGTVEEVRGLLDSLGLLASVTLVKGLFQDTLPNSTVGPVAVLHLDGDWYESTRCCLENLYGRVAHGGIIQIDDYGHWAGAKKATDEFMKNRQIQTPLEWVDFCARQLRKP